MFELSEKVFANDLILSKILSSLTLRQLTNSCLLVNKFWYRITKNVITKRGKYEIYFQMYRIGRHHRAMKHSSVNRESHLVDNKSFPFVSECFQQLETKLMAKIRDEMYIRPNLVLTFFGNFCKFTHKPENLMQYNALRKYFPPETQFLNVISSSGLIGTAIKLSESKNNKWRVKPIESQAGVGNSSGLSLLVLPKYKNVDIDVIQENSFNILEKLIERNDLKCLLVLTTTEEAYHLKEFQIINKLREKYNNKIAIGGIAVSNRIDEINYLNSNLSSTVKENQDFFVIAFSGSHVRASSLHFNTITPETTEQKFRQFRKDLDFDSNLKMCETIAFMFVSTGRGLNTEGYYPISNVEADLFRKVFPGVKVIGLFGQGEYGHNYWPSITREQQLCLSEEIGRSSCNPHELWHFHTSVLLIINWPKN